MEGKVLTCPIYWTHEGKSYTGTASYVVGKVIELTSDDDNYTFDSVYDYDCADGITLDDIWSDLMAQRDDDGRLNVTDIELV